MGVRIVVCVCLLGALGLGCPLRKDAIGPRGDAGVDHPDKSGPVAGNAGFVGTGGNGGGAAGSPGSGGNGVGGAPVQNDGGQVDAPPLLKDLAATCSNKLECASGNCVDGVCCDGVCADGCSACNIKDFVGHCSLVPAGGVAPSPHPACPKMAASTCKQNGACDGKGACQLYPGGEVCAAGTCSATTQLSVTGSACDGLGTCKPAPAVACTPFKCKSDGTACATTCVADGDCQGQPCVSGSCGKVANGNKCTTAAQCTSGNCVDGYCCSTASCPTCQACNLATPGTCGNKAPAAADVACVASKCQSGTCNGMGVCTVAGDGAMCGTNLFCKTGVCGMCSPNLSCVPVNSPCKTGTTSCTSGTMTCPATGNKPLNTPCGGVASCTGTTLTHAMVCDASGGCPAATTQPCPNGCNAAKTDCLNCATGVDACNGICCGAATPRCLSSTTCVECTSDTSCPSNKPSCDPSNHTCVCRRKSAGNLLNTSGFNTPAEVVPSWISDPFVQDWTPDDADGCAQSGSIFGNIFVASNCVTVNPGITYFFGLKYKTTAGPDPLLHCNVRAFGSAGCSPVDPIVVDSPVLTLSPSASWKAASSSWLSSVALTSANLSCFGVSSPGGTAYIDQLYLNRTAASF